MSFHPLMVYDSERFQKSERARLDEGKPFDIVITDLKMPRLNGEQLTERSP